jgi:hypothetical protein
MQGLVGTTGARRAGALAAVVALTVALLVLLAPSLPAREAPAWHQYRADNVMAQLKRLNKMRTDFGARKLRLVDSWSDGCARHAYYMVRNDVITHEEDPSLPGYSAQGEKAAQTSVLAFPPTNPFPAAKPAGIWEEAPFHQLQLLQPALARTGIGKGCVNTLRDLFQSSAVPEPGLKLMLWPGPSSAPVNRTINACFEGPRDPFTAVGWSCSGRGPALYLYALDPTERACGDYSGDPKVTVTGPSGPVPARLAQTSPQACDWVIVIGRRLAAGGEYKVEVTLDSTVLTRRFSAQR